MELAEMLKEIQKSNGYTDQMMADKIGCSRPYYNQVRRGNVPITDDFRRKVQYALLQLGKRTSVVRRETRETDISVELNVDGSGKWDIKTGITMFDHLLAQLTRHGVFDIKISATGDDQHHLVEDVAICLGKAFGEALGDKRGIVRMADSTVPMDDALAMLVVDISGRGYAVLELPFSGNDMVGFSSDLIRHFLESFAAEARLNLHARVLYGINDHHKAEALFKALGRALDAATRIDERISREPSSTKEL
jgi:imidazoleglycerol-phosphate dehydratase